MAANDLNYYRGTWSLPVAQGMTADTLGGRTGGFRQREIVTHNNHQWIYVGAADDQLDEPGAAGNDTWRDLGSIVDESATITEQLDTLPIEQAHDYTTTGSLQWTLVADSSLDFLSNGVFQTEVLNADVTNTPAIGTNLYGFLAEPASLTGITENPDIVLRLSRIVPDVISPASTYYFNVVSGIQNITTASPTSSVVELTAAQTAMLNRLYVRSAATDANVEEVLTRNPDGTFDFQIPAASGSTVTDSAGTTITNLVIGRDILGAYDHAVVYGEGAEVEIIGGNAQITHWENLSGGTIAANIAPPVLNLLVTIADGQHIFPGQLGRLPGIDEAYARNNDQPAIDLTPADIPVTGTAVGSVSNGWTRIDVDNTSWTEIFDRLPTDAAAYPAGVRNSEITLPTAATLNVPNDLELNGNTLQLTRDDGGTDTVIGDVDLSPILVGDDAIVPVFDDSRSDYVLNEMVRSGSQLFVVNNVANANSASDPFNGSSGFFAVGGVDSTHTLSYSGQTLAASPFTLAVGDTLFLQELGDATGATVEVYQIRSAGLSVTATDVVLAGGITISKTATDALNQFRGILAPRAARTDNIGLLRETDFGAGIARSGDHLVVDIDTNTLDYNGGAIEVKEDGITTDRIADLNVTHAKLADNAVSNRNIGDRAVHGDNIDSHTIERDNLSFALQAQIDASSDVTVTETMGEVETGTVIRPTNLTGSSDWEMHVLPDGSRTITFTEVDAPDLSSR